MKGNIFCAANICQDALIHTLIYIYKYFVVYTVRLLRINICELEL